MRVSIWCRRDIQQNVEGLEVWAGEWPFPALPRVDDFIVVWDGWAAQPVKSVYFSVEEEFVEIEIGPDYTGEYAVEVARRSEVGTEGEEE